MEKRILHLDYEVDFAGYREYFLEEYKKGLPRMFAFWGTGFIISVALFFAFHFEPFFALLALAMAAIPITTFVMGYQSLLRHTKTAFKNLADEEKKVHLTFQEDSDGFDAISGKNFSHTSWSSIQSIAEKENYFVFTTSKGFFVVPKNAFHNSSEIEFFKSLVHARTNSNRNLIK